MSILNRIEMGVEEELEVSQHQQQHHPQNQAVSGDDLVLNDNHLVPLLNDNFGNNNNDNNILRGVGNHLINEQCQQPLQHGCEDNWSWSKRYRSKEVVLSGNQNRNAEFHPNWSRGTAGVRGKRQLNNGRFYWELHLTRRVFGTSIMFGIGTRNCRLHANSFTNMLGEDEFGWGLSHKGILWHKGVALLYTSRFRENRPTVIGILFDGIEGTLTYFKDGKSLGVAFRGLDKIKEPLYPIICSTAAKSEMTLKSTRRDFVNLQDRCRAEIIKHVKHPWELKELKLPPIITEYLAELYYYMKPLQPVDNYVIMCDL